ncbi:unnamed protein product [Brachionus calyciflorus]|uniref:Uncharacterized protein n=1 Tax=Brachionus calyciflorus TaxID=104777 RepID=A0A813N007_9BILA|nr:unnamed protein product [Brachionus calyciflorus]
MFISSTTNENFGQNSSNIPVPVKFSGPYYYDNHSYPNQIMTPFNCIYPYPLRETKVKIWNLSIFGSKIVDVEERTYKGPNGEIFIERYDKIKSHHEMRRIN